MAMLSKAVLPCHPLPIPPTGSWVRCETSQLVSQSELFCLCFWLYLSKSSETKQILLRRQCCLCVATPCPSPLLGAGCGLRSQVARFDGLRRRAEGTDPLWEQRARIHIQSSGHLSALHGSTYNHYAPDHLMAACFSISLLRYELIPHQRSRGRQLTQCT